MISFELHLVMMAAPYSSPMENEYVSSPLSMTAKAMELPVVFADRRRPDEDSGRVGLGDDENEDGPGAVGAAGIVELLAHGRAALVELAHSRDGLFEDAADVVA